MSFEISEQNIILHEFIGLKTSIIDTPCKSLINVTGIIVDETKNTFKIEYLVKNKPKIIIVPKHKTRFRITIPSNDPNLEPRSIDLDGSLITKRPEDRIKKLAKLVRKRNKKISKNGN